MAIFIVITSSTLASCAVLPLGAVICSNKAQRPHPRAFPRNAKPARGRARPLDPPVPSCAKPAPADAQACHQLEQQMLASTVRLEWQGWSLNDKNRDYTVLDGTIGYATVKEGRYLVTHNHAGMPLSKPKNGTFVTVSIFATDGDPIWL